MPTTWTEQWKLFGSLHGVTSVVLLVAPEFTLEWLTILIGSRIFWTRKFKLVY